MIGVLGSMGNESLTTSNGKPQLALITEIMPVSGPGIFGDFVSKNGHVSVDSHSFAHQCLELSKWDGIKDRDSFVGDAAFRDTSIQWDLNRNTQLTVVICRWIA